MMASQKKKSWWLVPLLAATLLYGAFAFTSQSKDLYTVNLELKELESRIQKEKDRQKSLIEEKDDLSSTESIEKIAREKLGMVKDGERVFVDTNK